MSYRDEFKEGSRDFLWTLPRVLGLAFVGIVAVFLLAVALTPLTIAFGWYNGEANLRSFNHVKATYQEAYDDVNSMEANVRQACRIQPLVAADTTGQRQSQLLAVENNFDRIKGEYDAYMSDHFRGGVIRPRQLPMPYPTLGERTSEVCP